MEGCSSLKRSLDAIVGLRLSNGQSGVGLFNSFLARELSLPYVLLKDYEGSGFPLFSLKFEELAGDEEQRLRQFLSRQGSSECALFLHTLSGLEAEILAARKAGLILCGNDEVLSGLSREPGFRSKLVRAFAPSLILEKHRRFCRPGGVEFFYFGMAGKVDCGRFTRLRSQLEALGVEYKLLCSLAVHQTSDGSCLSDALGFFEANFTERFVFLGNLTEMGVSYFLNSPTVFLGFYRGGLRANNTTFNTALRFGKTIITNLDEHSPPEVRALRNVLDIDSATTGELRDFLVDRRDGQGSLEGPDVFTWERLLAIVEDAVARKGERRHVTSEACRD